MSVFEERLFSARELSGVERTGKVWIENNRKEVTGLGKK